MEQASRTPVQYASWRENSAEHSFAIVPEHSKPGSYREIVGIEQHTEQDRLVKCGRNRGIHKGKVYVLSDKFFQEFILAQRGKSPVLN